MLKTKQSIIELFFLNIIRHSGLDFLFELFLNIDPRSKRNLIKEREKEREKERDLGCLMA